MPEKSIILHAHEIRRLLDTGEARIWRPVKNVEGDCIKLRDGSYFPLPTCDRMQTHWSTTPTFCPFRPGERRWVREMWALSIRGDGEDGFVCLIRFAADSMEIEIPQFRHEWWNQCVAKACYHWRSPVTMPCWASRLAVEILDVEARQVWSITEEEAREAGIRLQGCLARDKFAHDWFWRYAKRGLGWEKNPWAWVMKVKVVPA